MFVCDGGGIVVSGVSSCCGLGTAHLGVGVVVYYFGSVVIGAALLAGGASPVPGASRRWA